VFSGLPGSAAWTLPEAAARMSATQVAEASGDWVIRIIRESPMGSRGG
jgi:hypothetical protein